ncbi:selenoprotein M [Turdus rufiventris]|nr:selenoprotein M [Turdus rufiventris]
MAVPAAGGGSEHPRLREAVLRDLARGKVERIPLSDMTREEINQLVQELGFYRKETPDAPVPEEFQFAPAKPLPILLHPQVPTADGKTPPKRDKEEHPDL